MPPRVFCRKSAEVIENKGSGREKERQESLGVRKRKEIKEIEEVREVRSARFVRDNTLTWLNGSFLVGQPFVALLILG